MGVVKIISGPVEAPKPENKAVIKGQGSIPYPKATQRKTPNIGKAKITKGQKRGTGAAQRGGSFTIA